MTPIYETSASQGAEYELFNVAGENFLGVSGFALRTPVHFDDSFDDEDEDFDEDSDDDEDFDDDDFDDDDFDDDTDDFDNDEDEDEDEDEEEQIPSHVRAIMALASEVRGSEEKVSLLEWKRGRMDLSEVDDSAWLMYCYPRLASLGLNAQMVDSKPTQLFSVNELFDDVLVFSAEKVQR